MEMHNKGNKVDRVDQVDRYWETNGRERGQLVAALPAKQVEVENFTLDTDFTSYSTKDFMQHSTT